MSKSVVKPEATDGNITRRMRFACWVSKPTRARTHSNAPANPQARTDTHTHTDAYTHTEICNSYCFCTATVVSWTRLNTACLVACIISTVSHTEEKEYDEGIWAQDAEAVTEEWRKLRNEQHPDCDPHKRYLIIWMRKQKIIRRPGHGARLWDTRNTFKDLAGKPEGNKLLRSRTYRGKRW